MQVAAPLTPQAFAWIVVPAGLGLAFLWSALRARGARRRSRERLFRSAPREAAGTPVQDVREERAVVGQELGGSLLERWLFVAGYRSSGAVAGFLMAQGLALAVGVGIAVLLAGSEPLKTGVRWLEEIPAIGAAFALILFLAPWILILILGLLPLSAVRSRRRRIVQEVERDLPIVLALLSTLVESGLSFDAALERILASLDPDRALAIDLRLFRSETQAGIPRLTCFRRLARRVDVPAMSSFVSSLIHAENVGGGIAESLRRQADEVWSRRREQAVQRAQTLPTKLAIPLVCCFLPGIFVFTFGPAVAEFLRIAEGAISGS